jgi:hypothetical protein
VTGRLRVPSSGRDQARSGGHLPSSPHVDAGSSGVRRSPLPDAVRGRMERAFGADFSSVVLRQDDTAAAMEAAAYTRGEVITVGPGSAEPHTPEGLEMIGHELAHVLQQRQGRVPGRGLIEDPSLEAEADQDGARAARGESLAAATATGEGPVAGEAPAAGTAAVAQPWRFHGPEWPEPDPDAHREMRVPDRLGDARSSAEPARLGTTRLGTDPTGALPGPLGTIELRGAHEAAHALQPPDVVAYRRSQSAHPFAHEG